jgi:hypothetical protein
LWFDGRAVGGLVIFDNGDDYAAPMIDIIDSAHDDVYENSNAEPLLHEELTRFIYDYLDEINPNEELYEVGSLIAESNPVYSSEGESVGILIIGESGEGEDSVQSLITLNNIRTGEYKVFMFGTRNPENNNCVIPKVLLILNTESATGIGLKSGFAQKIDLKKEMELWNKATVFARIGDPLAVPVMISNHNWAQVRLVGGLANETIDDSRALDLRLESLSWLLMVSRRIDSKEILSSLEKDLETFSEFISSIHHLRGQFGRGNLNPWSLNEGEKSSKTSFESKLEILAQLNSAAKEDDELTDEFMEFVSFNDIGLPLAYLANNGLCDLTELGTQYVSETWTLLLKFCEAEDQGFESLEDILKLS